MSGLHGVTLIIIGGIIAGLMSVMMPAIAQPIPRRLLERMTSY